MTPNIQRLQGYLTATQQNPTLGVLPANSFVLRAHLHVLEAFDASGSDNIQCGWDSDNNAIFTNTDVSSTGRKTPTLGANEGFNATAQIVEAYYTAGSGSPSNGSAFILVEFMQVPPQP